MAGAILLVLLIAGAGSARAADPVAAAVKANKDFQQVDRSPRPSAADAQACVKSHEALAGITKADQIYLVHYRTGYCAMFWALATNEPAIFQRAAQDLAQAVATYPKQRGPVPAPVRILQILARIELGRRAGSFPDTQTQLRALVTDAACTTTPVMDTSFCLNVIDLARVWVAWLSYEREDFADALRSFSMHAAAPLSGGAQAWQQMMDGRSKLRQLPQPEFATLLEAGLERWARAAQDPVPDLVVLLGPRPDLPALYMQLANLNAALGKHSAAIAAYDAAVKERPSLSRAIFLRGKSKEALGLAQTAIADYALAAELAQNHGDTSWATGDALFRRGVVYFQLKNYKAAQTEFSAALGKPLSEVSRADLTAWRVMSGVSGGDCTSAGVLESSARAASDLFPKVEAQSRVFECRLGDAKSVEQLQQLERQSSGLPPEQVRILRARLAVMFADQGVEAEDKSDPMGAIAAYTRAIEYDPASSKARFNLGAIYIDRKQFDLAEAQFRALTKTDPGDFEARYWLGESILAQAPTPERRAEACGFLRDSLAIADPEKKKQFASAHKTAKCGS